ncbi:MAG: hypothetical protein ACK5HA_13015 [Planctomycetaceae bacterium]
MPPGNLIVICGVSIFGLRAGFTSAANWLYSCSNGIIVNKDLKRRPAKEKQ